MLFRDSTKKAETSYILASSCLTFLGSPSANVLVALGQLDQDQCLLNQAAKNCGDKSCENMRSTVVC